MVLKCNTGDKKYDRRCQQIQLFVKDVDVQIGELLDDLKSEKLGKLSRERMTIIKRLTYLVKELKSAEGELLDLAGESFKEFLEKEMKK